MNFHDKSGIDAETADAALVYSPAPRHAVPRASLRRRLRAEMSAPFYGSRFVFPRRFDHAVDSLLERPAGGDLSPAHAAWYFGASLHLDIDPAHLVNRISDYVCTPDGSARWVGNNFLDAADWSAALSPIDQSPVHREMSELVAAGRDYRDTHAYRILVYGIEVNRPGTRNGVLITDTDKIEAYLHYCRDLIKSARKRGVVRHRVSGPFHRLRLKHRGTRSLSFDTTERDIGVAINADGEIIRHLGGKHRTAIAQALKLTHLPVEIRLIHVRWIAAQMERTGLPAHLAVKQGLSELPGAKRAPA